MMKKQDYDRIVVKTNARMTEIIDWFFANADWLKEEGFNSPMQSGLIVMEEEKIDIGFEIRPDGLVDMSLYPCHIATPVMTWVYNPITTEVSDHKFPHLKTPENRALMKTIIYYDNTDAKEVIKFHALMMFAAHYEEIVEVDEKQNVRRTRHEAKKLRKNPKQPLNLVRKTFVVKDFKPDELRKYGEKRKYTKPDHEVQVRGYYRRTKSGKKIWIAPFSRYKDKGNKQRKEYKV